MGAASPTRLGGQHAADDELMALVHEAATNAGIDAVGVTDAAPFLPARTAILERKAAGLHAGMWFTYGRPERSTEPSRILDGARSIVVCARKYRGVQTPPDSAPPGSTHPDLNSHGTTTPESTGGTVAAYVAEDAYGALAAGLERICEVLRNRGCAAVAVSDDNRLVDRAAAARAGLGWLGRNTMLLSDELGSWTVLGAVVTTAVLPVAGAPQPDGCGSCRRCSVACPTGALDVAGVLDANRCLAWMLQATGSFPAEFRVALGDRLYGCDDCQVVCPYNEALGPTADASRQPVQLRDRAAASRAPCVDVIGLLQMSDEQLMATFGHWYIPRRRPEYLRRNALVVLGNVADRDAPDVERVLRQALASTSAVVAAHAVWAARRLGHDDLVADAEDDGLGDNDPDGLVAAELLRRVPRRSGAV
ncbi:tRNA epoxyqueuosine(34) reductase QueG [Candidatus Poriferisodalis sp.]|uniref:tRNA epoxyqueuosine(34) reductase QueG n=1 Tax=Candidatus Poriferisodalis sp. TaxID=3101277 RepID=UPI003D110E31